MQKSLAKGVAPLTRTQIGPFDLAKQMNVVRGGEEHEAAIQRILKAAKAAGKIAAIFCRSSFHHVGWILPYTLFATFRFRYAHDADMRSTYRQQWSPGEGESCTRLRHDFCHDRYWCDR